MSVKNPLLAAVLCGVAVLPVASGTALASPDSFEVAQGWSGTAFSKGLPGQGAAPSRRVEVAQRLLAKLGYGVGVFSNTLTAETIAAVEAFQRAENLPVDGVISDALLGKLRTRAWSRQLAQQVAARRPGAILTKDQVKQAQVLLARYGFEPGPTDGRFGGQTMVAIEAYQQQIGVSVDGVLTADLLANLLRQEASGAAPGEDRRDQVKVYNWPDYIAPEVLAEFEKTTGVKVVYDTFDSNTVLEKKLAAKRSGYDVVVPSGNFLARNIENKLFREISQQELKNFANLDKTMLAQTASWDPGNKYAVPYLWGTTGIAFNEQKVKAAVKNPPLDSWRMVFDPAIVRQLARCGVRLVNDEEEVVRTVLQYLGEDPRATDPQVLAKAAPVLKEIAPHIRKDDKSVIEALGKGEICAAMIYSGDAMQARDMAAEADKPFEIKYAIPKEGASIWVDVLAVPADAPNPGAAVKLIDFLLRPEVIGKITNATYYPNANEKSKPFISPEIIDDRMIFPDEKDFRRLFTNPAPTAATAAAVEKAAAALR